MGGFSANKVSPQPVIRPTLYRVNDDGTIDTLEGYNVLPENGRQREGLLAGVIEGRKTHPYDKISDAINEASKKTRKSVVDLEKKYAEELSREREYSAIAEQISRLSGGVRTQSNLNSFNQAVSALGGERNYGASDLGTRLNFQVSDQQIIDDYNNAKRNRLG